MRTMLDNSTVTAAFRALGIAPVSNRALFDMDISALRTLIDHILLSKEIYIPDNYQIAFSEERKRVLSHPNVHFFKVNTQLDKKALREAVSHVHNWGLISNLAQGYQHIFEEMNILFTHAWRNSEAFLVLSHFGVENKYNNSIMHQFVANEFEKEKISEIRVKGYNSETIKVAQKLSWAAVRTVYNRELAKLYGAEYVPHPTRNMFNAKCILFDNHPSTRKFKAHSLDLPRHSYSNTIEMTGRDNYIQDLEFFFKNFWIECAKEDENVFGVSTYNIEMPPFLSTILNQVNRHSTPEEIINSIFELRDSREVTDLREKLNKIYFETPEVSKNERIREFAFELKDLKGRMQKYLGYSHEKVSLSLNIISYDQNIPRFLIRPLYPHKPRLAFVRDIILDLSNVSSLGKLHDNLWSINARKV